MTDWLHASGEMATLIRAHDWASTPLGPAERWPVPLRTAVEMILAMPGPANILWGPEHLQFYNDAYIAIAKERHPALLGRPAAEGWPEIHAEVLAPVMKAAFAGRATRMTDLSVQLQGPDGRQEDRAFDTTWSPIRDETGAVGGALEILAEVTDRHRATVALRASEARHRLLIESWTQAVWETDAEGVVVADSPSWRAYTGQTLEEWLGYGWLDAIHPDDRAYAERQWREAVAACGLVDAEFRLLAPDGGWRWTNVRAAPVLDAEGRIEKWAGMNIDIDARKRAEAALRESEEQFRTLADTAPALIWRNDATGENLFINRHFLEFTGKSAEETRGEGWHTLIHPDDAPAYVADCLGAVKAARAWHSTSRIRRQDGAWRWFENDAHPLQDARGDYTGHVGVSFDITDRIEAEQALRALQERQAVLLELSDALRLVPDAHDVQAITTRLVAEHLGVDRAMYAEVEGEPGAETGIIRAQFVRQVADGEAPVARFPDRFTFDPFGAHTMAARYRGEPLVVTDVASDPAFGAAERAAWQTAGVRAAIVAPLAKGGRLVAEFGVHCVGPRGWTNEEVALIQEVAERTWAAVERARAETALRESEERYRALFESMDEAYAVIEVLKDAAGSWVDFRFIEVNPAFLVHTSMPWPVGQTATELLGEPNPRWTELYGQALDTGEPIRVEESEPTLDRVFDLNIFALDHARNRVAVLFTNVTERKSAEAALRESEALFRTVAEVIEDVFYVTDIGAGRLDYLSPAYEAVWGRSAAELTADLSRFIETIHPEDRAGVEASKVRQARGEAVHSEYRIVRPDGEVRWILDRCFPIPDGGRRLSVGVASDVTQRRVAEERVRASEERYRLLLQSVRDYAIFTMDREGLITSWPAGAAAVYGWPEAEIIGRSVDLTFLPEDVASGAPQGERDTALLEGLAPNVRWHRRRDGARIFIDGSTQPLVGADGAVREFIKIGQDVTRARRTQEALAQSEERLRLALEVGRLAAWDWDLRTGAVQWSDEHYRMQGYAVGEVTPSYDAWAARLHPDDRPGTEADLRAACADGGDYAREFRSLHPDGTVRWLSAYGRFFRGDRGEPHRMVGAMIDVTERREWAERQEVMVAELQHRTRNLIAVVRSISNQTMAETGPNDAFRGALNHRLEALARVQGLLSRSEEAPITIEHLIRMELHALGGMDEDGERVELRGPTVILRSAIVQTLALGLHELATNARKHGALSNAEGRLHVTWRIADAGVSGRHLLLDWIESGIALTDLNPARRGYGLELIERALPYALNARTAYELRPGGVHCTIDLPLEKRERRRRSR